MADGDRSVGWVVSPNEVAPGRSTRRFANSGRNPSMGSSSWKWPSSNSNSAALAVISLVLEKTRKMWSTRRGIRASLSAHPMHFKSTKSLPTSTAKDTPERTSPSTYRCMASCAGRKSESAGHIFMASIVIPTFLPETLSLILLEGEDQRRRLGAFIIRAFPQDDKLERV